MTGELDPVIHPTYRLRICAMLVAGSPLELSIVKRHLDLSPSALSKQVGALVDAGYVKQERLGSDTRRVWLSMTRQGLKAYRGHVAALREIVNAVDQDAVDQDAETVDRPA